MVDHYPLFEFAAMQIFMLCSFGISTEASAPVVLYFRGTTFSRFKSRIDSKHENLVPCITVGVWSFEQLSSKRFCLGNP